MWEVKQITETIYRIKDGTRVYGCNVGNTREEAEAVCRALNGLEYGKLMAQETHS